ncbi:MAG: ABC transporter ATP-binding protein [Bacteroidaceae bacterium]|nr:ABC transporter ATP-binding protein [Bacteroidaceae bacterium]
MIKIDNLTKRFGDLSVLKGVSLEVKRGEVISIVGPSGAGKTTLLQLIGTLDKPDSGSIYFEGEDLSRMNSKRLATFRNKHIGFVFQFHQLLPEFTALENIIIPALIAGRDRKDAEKEALDLLKMMKLEERAGHKPSEMSGGENQRIAVARALINHPDVVLADEPSGSLDSKNKEELHKLFFDLRDKFGQTFIIVTHDEALASFTDRTIRMVDGTVAE